MLQSCLKMLLARVKIKNFLPEERGTPSPGPLPPEPWPCHIPSKLLMLLILTEMQLKRFKKQKSPTQGKGTPLSSDHNPLQPWPFAYAKYPIDVPYFNLLYRARTLKRPSYSVKKKERHFHHIRGLYPHYS